MEPQSLDEFLQWEPQYPAALIGKGILHAQSKAIIYGRYKTFKSLLALYLALCVAQGIPWLGFDVPPAGAKVLYLQLEVPHPLLHKRMMKMWRSWVEVNGNDPVTRDRFHIWTETFLKLDRAEGLARLNAELSMFKPDILIVDPLYKVLSGNILDPNSTRALLDSIDKLIGDHQVAVVMLHHPRKSILEEEPDWGSEDMLGSVLFSAWADTIGKVIRKGEKAGRASLTLNFDVVRHAEDLIEPTEVILDRSTLMFHLADEFITL